MEIGNFRLQFVSHVCFIFASAAGRKIITDPLFADGFQWVGHFEKYLTRPAFPAGEITECDLIFVTHIHGDHYDPEAVQTIMRRTAADVLAPHDVLDDLDARGVSRDRMVAAEEGGERRVGDVLVTTYNGYDNSWDEKRRPNKFSLFLETRGTRIFYSGDCHETPPAMRGRSVDAVCMWPHPDDEKLKAFCEPLQFRTFVLMHCDGFDPGDFICNMDMAEQQQRVAALVPGVEVVIPERIGAP